MRVLIQFYTQNPLFAPILNHICWGGPNSTGLSFNPYIASCLEDSNIKIDFTKTYLQFNFPNCSSISMATNFMLLLACTII